MANLVAALAPLLTSGRATSSQQQQSTSPTGNLLADLMAPPPARTQAEQLRTSIGGIFGLDTRPATEKLADQLANIPLSTSEGLKQAAALAKNLGLSRQAMMLATEAGTVEQQEKDDNLRRKREQQIIDMFLADNQATIEMVVEGEGTDAPTEDVSGEPPVVPAGETPEGTPLMTGAEQRAFLDKVGNDKAAQVAEINRLVVKRLDEEDAAGRRLRTGRERSRRAAQLRAQYYRILGVDLTPSTIATPAGPF